jgi:hypothetical protein
MDQSVSKPIENPQTIAGTTRIVLSVEIPGSHVARIDRRLWSESPTKAGGVTFCLCAATGLGVLALGLPVLFELLSPRLNRRPTLRSSRLRPAACYYAFHVLRVGRSGCAGDVSRR